MQFLLIMKSEILVQKINSYRPTIRKFRAQDKIVECIV